MLAIIRPTDWNWLLLGHLAAAMVLFGGVLAVATVSLAAQRRAWPDQVPLLRALAFRMSLLLVFPGFLATILFGEVLSNREFKHDKLDWVDIGSAITYADLILGGVLLTLLQFWVVRRTRAGEPGGWQATLATVLPVIVLGALVAVIVLMAGKPG